MCELFGSSLEIPMWLTDNFLVTCFGSLRDDVHIGWPSLVRIFYQFLLLATSQNMQSFNHILMCFAL